MPLSQGATALAVLSGVAAATALASRKVGVAVRNVMEGEVSGMK